MRGIRGIKEKREDRKGRVKQQIEDILCNKVEARARIKRRANKQGHIAHKRNIYFLIQIHSHRYNCNYKLEKPY